MKNIKSLFTMNLGVVLLSIGVYFFKIPNGFSTGGVTGVGTILGSITPISSGAWIWILNIALLILGFALFGKEDGNKNSILQYGLFGADLFI